MRGGRALRAEILDRLDEAAAEEHLPPAVHRHPRGERMPRIDEPAGKREPVGRSALRQRRQEGGHAWGDRVARGIVLPPVEHVRLPRRGQVGHHHHVHRAILDGGDLLRRPRIGLFTAESVVDRDERRLVGMAPQLHERPDHIDQLAIRVLRQRVRDAVKEGEELEILPLRNRIELVVVAAGALEREPHEGGGRGLRAVGHVFHAILLVDHAPFGREHVVAAEAGGDPLGLRRLGQEVARELLDHELVERHIAGEGIDHPVTPRPLRSLLVVVVAVGVGVAGDVEPVHRHLLSMPRRGEQPIDHPLAGVG